MNHRFAILIDGGFFTRKLYSKLKRNPSVDDVMTEIELLRSNTMFDAYELLRIYYYDALPATGKVRHPITGQSLNLAETPVFTRNKAFFQSLELQPNVSLRAGELSPRGYKLKKSTMDDKALPTRALVENDFVLDIEQKGVDLRIGLDIARLSLTRMVQTIVVVTGDSDFIPAFKFARREGVRVVLAHMGHGVKSELKAHTDGIV
ncbi:MULTISPECIES: NYN domain-containing protein [Roseobacteraceae]|uniref:NYN domain-containing protein n=1 Tax=Roseobacteraceae TaxID=2854170 RepID=UPI00125FFBB1|nr:MULTISPECIES: NYN domain-containing protein [Roseobacteraceae]KAB6716707.1 NYN domain-containing protein [Roseobacter sp. TSBP12]|tara:strand:- start:4635 stop:5249 length:615 start_codon:yes stop_codon:yes gene_type:complete